MPSRFERKIQAWIRNWTAKGYADGIPDEAPETLEELGRVPSYRILCMAIMKNDHALQMLGYSRPPCELYNSLKRVEINARAGARKAEKQPEQILLSGIRS